jgi:hypothetical protein
MLLFAGEDMQVDEGVMGGMPAVERDESLVGVRGVLRGSVFRWVYSNLRLIDP